MRCRPKLSMDPPADQMPLHVENGRVDRNKALSRFGGFEALHFSFASSKRLVRILRAIVGAQSLIMQTREANFAERSAVGS